MRRVATLVLIFVSLTAGSAPLPEWEQPSTLKAINQALTAMAQSCAKNFGFAALPPLPEAEARDKIDGFLLLDGEPEVRERAWLSILQGFASLTDTEGTVTKRASEALGAAVDDPATYEQAQSLYVETMMNAEKDAITQCAAASRDPFIGAHYLSGEGHPSYTEDSLKGEFANGVKQLTAYKEKLRQKAKR